MVARQRTEQNSRSLARHPGMTASKTWQHDPSSEKSVHQLEAGHYVAVTRRSLDMVPTTSPASDLRNDRMATAVAPLSTPAELTRRSPCR